MECHPGASWWEAQSVQLVSESQICITKLSDFQAQLSYTLLVNENHVFLRLIFSLYQAFSTMATTPRVTPGFFDSGLSPTSIPVRTLVNHDFLRQQSHSCLLIMTTVFPLHLTDYCPQPLYTRSLTSTRL